MLLHDLVVCGAYCYAESAVPIGDRRRKFAVDALHNYTGRRTSLNIAISLSGTWNLPRLSVGGIAMARASSIRSPVEPLTTEMPLVSILRIITRRIHVR